MSAPRDLAGGETGISTSVLAYIADMRAVGYTLELTRCGGNYFIVPEHGFGDELFETMEKHREAILGDPDFHARVSDALRSGV